MASPLEQVASIQVINKMVKPKTDDGSKLISHLVSWLPSPIIFVSIMPHYTLYWKTQESAFRREVFFFLRTQHLAWVSDSFSYFCVLRFGYAVLEMAAGADVLKIPLVRTKYIQKLRRGNVCFLHTWVTQNHEKDEKDEKSVVKGLDTTAVVSGWWSFSKGV